MNQDGLQALRAFRGRLNDQLMKLPEYRAIAVIDRTIQEISEIFETLPAATQPRELAVASSRSTNPTSISDTAQNRIAMAIADAIESNVSQLRTQRLPPAAPYMVAGAAS